MSNRLNIVLVALWAIAVWIGFDLTRWEYFGDTPLLNYAGWLMVEQGQMPYRDFFETSMPGTFFVHVAIMWLGLDGNSAFLGLGFALYALLGLVGSLILHRAGSPSGPLFALIYISLMLFFTASSIFQRELVATLFIAGAVLVAFRAPQFFWIGFLFALAALIKPQLAFPAPIVVICAVLLHKTPAIRSIFVSLIGFAIPLAVAAFWLISIGAWDRFVFLIIDYLPLHIQQTTYHVFLDPLSRLKFKVKNAIQFGGFWVLVGPPALLTLGQWLARHSLTRHQHITFACLTLLAAAYSIIPFLAGQFWNYHYFPFIFFSCLAGCSALIFAKPGTSNLLKACGIGAALALPILQGILLFDARMIEKNARDVDRVKAMQAAIEQHLPEGGYVQPIDWTRGAIHAMLRARALLATPFFYDYHFRHHVSSDVTRQLREEFVIAMIKTRPEIILEVPKRPKMKGKDASYDWPELEQLMSENYRIVEQTEEHIVHLRDDLE